MFGIHHQSRSVRHVAGLFKHSLETRVLAQQLAIPFMLRPAFKALFLPNHKPAYPLACVQRRLTHSRSTFENLSFPRPRAKPTLNPSRALPPDSSRAPPPERFVGIENPEDLTLAQRAESILRNKRFAAEWSRLHIQALRHLEQHIGSDSDPGTTLAFLHEVEAQCKEMVRQSDGKLPHDVAKVAKLVDELIPKVRAQTGTARKWWRNTLGRIAWGPTIVLNVVIAIIFG